MYKIVNIETCEKSEQTFKSVEEAEEFMLLNAMDCFSEDPEYMIEEVRQTKA